VDVRKFDFTIKKILFIILIIFIFFIILELVTKIFYLKAGNTIIYHKYFGWINKPDSIGAKFTGSKINFYSYDNLGFRITKEQVKNKQQKIFIVGDSIIDAREVNENSHLQNILRKLFINYNYDIFTFGVSGWGTDQEYLFINSLLNKEKEIKLIGLTFYTGNDFHNNIKNEYKTFFKTYYKPYFKIQNDTFILLNNPVPQEKLFFGFEFFKKYSSFYKFSNEIIFPLLLKIINKNNNFNDFYLSSDFEKSSKITEFLLKDLNNKLNNNKKFFVIIIPSMSEVRKKNESEYIKKIRTICEENKILYINCYLEFNKNSKKPERDYYLQFDGHLNENGHLVLAKIIFNFLTQNNLLN